LFLIISFYSGAVAGIGLVEGRRNVQWMPLFKVCISWVVIFFVSCILSAGLFPVFAFSPSLSFVSFRKHCYATINNNN
jgi:hypothetical protein